MKICAVIFDLDGVICYTDEYHYQAWKGIADELNIEFNRQIANRLRGVSRMDSLDIILENYAGRKLSLAEKTELAERKNTLYREKLANMRPESIPDGVMKTLIELKNRGRKLAIGSSSKNAKYILEKTGLFSMFDAVVDGNQIVRAKPDPEVFLKAAEMVKEAPGTCLVVEDAVSGAMAGHAGGLRVACIGDAAEAGAGDYNLKRIEQVLDISGLTGS